MSFPLTLWFLITIDHPALLFGNLFWHCLGRRMLFCAEGKTLCRIKEMWGQHTAGHERHWQSPTADRCRHDHDINYDSCLEGGLLWN